MAGVEDDIGAAPPPPPPAAKDPLDFNTLTVTGHLVAWANDPKNSKTVKTRDREEIIFLQCMQKYEAQFWTKIEGATDDGCAFILLYPT